jgi:ATP-dependent Lon protease
MMMTEMVIETSVQYVHLTRLIAREDYIKFTRRESTKTYIVNRYGKATHQNIRRMEQLRKTKARLSSLAFLRRCRDQRVVPLSLQLKHHINTEVSRRILRRASSALLRERIRHIRRRLDTVTKELFHLHQLLSGTLTSLDWDLVDSWTMAEACTLQATTTTKHKRKFEHLHGIQHPEDQIDANKVVINLSNKDLEPAAVSILSKGLNYAQTTSIKSNMKDFISGIEQAIHHLPTETAEEIRQEASRIIRLAKPQRTNTSKAEREALRTLRNDDSITILPADKGNATVILSSTDYKSKIISLLDDHVYKKLLYDPTSKTEKQTASLIKGSALQKRPRRS